MMNRPMPFKPAAGKRKKKIGGPAPLPEQKMRKGKKVGKLITDVPGTKRRKPKAPGALPSPRPEKPRKLPKGKGKGNSMISELITDVPGTKRKKRKRISTAGDSDGAKPIMFNKGGKVKGYNKGGMCGASMPPARPVKKA